MLKKSENIQTTRRVNIETINADMNLRMRVAPHKDTIAEYAAAIKLDASAFPPLDCGEVDGELMLYDGFLRHAAYKKQGVTDVLIRSRIGTHADVVLWAVQANAHEGLARGNKDKQRSVEKLLEIEEHRRLTNQQVAAIAGVDEITIRRYRAKQGKPIDIVDSLPSKKPTSTRINSRGERRPTNYKPRKSKDISAPRPASKPDAKPVSQPGSRTYVPPYEKMKWPTDAEIGKPSPELQNEPHPDYPGMTYLQVFKKENPGYVFALPLERKRKEEIKIATHEIVGRVRDIGASCKALLETVPGKISVDNFAVALDEIPSSALWRSKLDQHRADIEAALPVIRAILDRTRKEIK